MHKNFVKNDNLIGIHLHEPNKGLYAPLIVLFPAFDGHSEFIVTYGHRLVDHGFQVFIADMYGGGQKFTKLDDCFAALEPLLKDRKLVRKLANKNIEAAIAASDMELEATGAMGFCFGGTCVLEVARAGFGLPAYFCAHSRLTKDKELDNNLLEDTNIMLAQGYADTMAKPTELQEFAEEMSDVNWSCIFYGNTKHSFTDHNVGAMDKAKEASMGREYNALSADNCFKQAVNFFEDNIC